MKAVVMAGGSGKRMGLVEKPLVNICGKPMIEWVVEALRKAQEIDEIWIATSPCTLETRRWAENKGFKVFETSGLGYEHDIAEISAYAAPCLVIASDIPLIEPRIIDEVIRKSINIDSNLVTVVTPLKGYSNFTGDETLSPINKEYQPVGVSVIKSPIKLGTASPYSNVVIDPSIKLLNVNTIKELQLARETICGSKMIHGGNIWAYGGPSKVLDFSSNSNPLGPPQLLIKALSRAVKEKVFSHYPEPTYIKLRESLSRFLGIDEKLIEVFNGASEAIFQTAYMLKPLNFVLTPPSFIEYWRAARLMGKKIYEVSYIDKGNKYAFNVNGIFEALEGIKKGLLFICNPNNPTGTLILRKYIEEITLEASRKENQVVVDESFMEFTGDDQSMLKLTEAYGNLHVVKSLTKIFASPGLRLGVVVSNSVSDLYEHISPWRVNALTSYSFTAMFQNMNYVDDYLKRSRKLVAQEKSKVVPTLKKLGLNPYKSSANFILNHLQSKLDSATLTETLALKHGILIRDASTIPGLNKRYIRVSVRKGNENMKLIEALSRVLNA